MLPVKVPYIIVTSIRKKLRSLFTKFKVKMITVKNEAVVKKSQKQIAKELKRSKANAAVNFGHLVGK